MVANKLNSNDLLLEMIAIMLFENKNGSDDLIIDQCASIFEPNGNDVPRGIVTITPDHTRDMTPEITK